MRPGRETYDRLVTVPISKTEFQSRPLEYLREVEETGVPLVISEEGRPVLRILPHELDERPRLERFRGLIRRFDHPTSPLATDWESTS